MQFIIVVLGRVLNRFSKDIGFMDDLLPYHFLELMSVSDSSHMCMHKMYKLYHFLCQLMMRFMAIMIVACVANYWLFIPATIIIAVLLLFRWFFLHTSRHVKRLEALGKAVMI